MKMKPATYQDVTNVASAIDMLCTARDLLRNAGATRTVERVRLAISSAKGAQRHVSRRAMRTERAHVSR